MKTIFLALAFIVGSAFAFAQSMYVNGSFKGEIQHNGDSYINASFRGNCKDVKVVRVGAVFFSFFPKKLA